MNRRAALIGLFFLVLLMNLNVLDNAFLDWDDNLLITQNPIIQVDGWAGLLRLLSPADALAGRHLEFIPLRDLGYAFNFYFFGLNPLPFHLMQIVAHAVTCLLLFWCALPWIGERAALIAAYFFAVHPVHVESVAWMSSLKDPTFCGAVLLSVGLFDRSLRSSGSRRRWLYLGALLAMLIGLGFKQIAIVIPALLLVPDVVFARRRLAITILDKIPFGLLGLAVLPLFLAIGKANAVIIEPPGGTRLSGLLTMTMVYAQYLGKLVAPYNLVARYVVHPVMSPGDPRFLGSLAVIAALWIGAAMLWKRTRIPIFVLAWLSIALLPVMNLIPIPIEMADRYLYLPSVGLVIGLGAGIDALLVRYPARSAAIGVAALGVLVLWLGLSVAQNDIWQDDVELWSSVTERSPEFGPAHANLAEAYRARGELDRAEQELRSLLAIRPDAGAWLNLGMVLLEQKRLPEARQALEQSAALDANNPLVYNDLGVVESRLEAWAPARAQFERALALDPEYAQAHHNLALACRALGDQACALEHLRRAIDQRPAEPAFLAEWLRNLKASHHGAEALSVRDRMERLFARDPTLWHLYGEALSDAGLPEANEALSRAERLASRRRSE